MTLAATEATRKDAETLTRRITCGLAEHGFVLLVGIKVEELSRIAAGLGIITVDRRSPEAFRRISPQETAYAKPNTLSSRFGSGQFPFHTDAAHWSTPPTHLMLYYEHPGRGKRCTHLLDTRRWFPDSSFQIALKSAVWKVGHMKPRLCVAAKPAGDHLAIRYDASCMKPIGTEAQELQSRIQHAIATSETTTISWEMNGLLVIDNSRMLHARGSASAPDHERVLIRALIGGVQ